MNKKQREKIIESANQVGEIIREAERKIQPLDLGSSREITENWVLPLVELENKVNEIIEYINQHD